MPSVACTVTAVAGKVLSGVEVASTIRSIVGASTCASASAARAAAIARSEVSSPSAAMWRSRMPVRCTIHSSEVSTDLRQIVVGQDAGRQIAAAAEHDRTDHGHDAAPPGQRAVGLASRAGAPGDLLDLVQQFVRTMS